MSTVTICVHSDKDKELLKKMIESAKFDEQVEVYEDEEDINPGDLVELERRWAEYERNPSKGKTIEQVKKILENKHGV